jgi:DNA-binding NarL/FixJ family response regulator
VPGRPRVLLADDHAGVIKVLRRILADECDLVGTVGDGSEVADAAARLHPVVSVVDVNLPNVNGLDACREITRVNPQAKVIMITAMVDEAIKDAALAAGAIAFVHKSAAPDDLIAAIKQAWRETT